MNQQILILDEDQDIKSIVGDLKIKPSNGVSITLNSPLSPQLVIDKAGYNAYFNGNTITFPKKEFELLLLLASNPRKVYRRKEILSVIWGQNYRAKDSRSLDVHIRMLRKKLNNLFITTIRGVGYKLEKLHS